MLERVADRLVSAARRPRSTIYEPAGGRAAEAGAAEPLYTYKYINKPYKYYIYIKPYYNIYTTSTLLSLYMFVCSFAL